MWIAVAAFIASFLVLLTGTLMVLSRMEKAHRLQRIGPAPSEASILRGMTEEPASAKIEKLIYPFHRVLPRTEREVSVRERRLTQAGFREARHLDLFYASKVVVPCIL